MNEATSFQESLFIPWAGNGSGGSGERKGRLHARHIFPIAGSLGAPILLVHGAVENSGIFYSQSGKGLAPFLAREGFDVYAGDLGGRGQSEPRISRGSKHGQWESITQEIPAFAELIRQRRPEAKQVWMAHSWGGVLLLCVLARYPELRSRVQSLVFFATKRSVHVRTWEALFKIRFFWNRAARGLVRAHGYLPGRRYRIGSDNETDLSHAESRAWVIPGPWVDSRDGFDYAAALRAADLPPILFLTGAGDRSLGHPADVRALIEELGPGRSGVELRVLSRAAGNLHDYGHIDILTSRDAERDQFLGVVEWVRGGANS